MRGPGKDSGLFLTISLSQMGAWVGLLWPWKAQGQILSQEWKWEGLQAPPPLPPYLQKCILSGCWLHTSRVRWFSAGYWCQGQRVAPGPGISPRKGANRVVQVVPCPCAHRGPVDPSIQPCSTSHDMSQLTHIFCPHVKRYLLLSWGHEW